MRREEQRRNARLRPQALSEAERQLAPQPTGPFIWPVTGRITARFGVRTFAQRFHTGLDIAANLRVPVRAVATGHVLHVGYAVPGNRRASYGMYVTLLHGDGKVTLYAHLDDRVSPPQVEKGKIIDRGDGGRNNRHDRHYQRAAPPLRGARTERGHAQSAGVPALAYEPTSCFVR